jgi:hypothetical protein
MGAHGMKFSLLLRKIRHWVGQPVATSLTGLFTDQTHAFVRAQWVIRAFYGFLAFLPISLLPEWNNMAGYTPRELLWPVAWLAWVPLRQGILAILLLYLVGGIVGALLPQSRAARVVAFLGIFQFWAFNNSFGKIGHSLHCVLLIAFVLIFLPGGWQQLKVSCRLTRQNTILAFWTAQGVIMMSYTMAGLIKVIAGFYQMALGQPFVFSPSALSRHVADRLLQTNSTSWLGDLLIANTWAAWPLMLGTVYLELFAIVTLFRPQLQWFFVAGLVSFHVASYFTMTIIFPENCFLLILFCAGMPLLRGRWNWLGFLHALPLFGNILRWAARWKPRGS